MSDRILFWAARNPKTLGQIVNHAFNRGVISQVGDCWVWETNNKSGYATLGIGCGSFHAHKVFYTYFVGPVPEGLVIDHLCRNHSCVNPGHLEAVTTKINTRRGVIARLGVVAGPVHSSDAITYRVLGVNRTSAFNLVHRDAA